MRVLIGALALAGCAPEPTPTTGSPSASASSSPSAATSAPSPSAAPTDTPAPTSSPDHSTTQPVSLDLRLDGVVVVDPDGGERTYDLRADSDGGRQALFDLFGEVTPQRPDDRYPIDQYRWSGLTLTYIASEPASASVTFTAASEAGVALTAAGLSVGAAVADVEASGAELSPYGSYDGITEYRTDVRAVPGTSSLTQPGTVGEEYLAFRVEDGAVTMIFVGNNFSDI